MEPHRCVRHEVTLGGNEMWNLAKTCVMVLACLVMVGNARAVDTSQPFVAVYSPRKPVYLGEAWGPGSKNLGARVTARVVANCPYHLEASFRGLRHETSRKTISPKHLSVAINGRRVPVGKGRVPIATSRTPTPVNGVDVPVELEVGVEGLSSYPAGRYHGILVITVMAGP